MLGNLPMGNNRITGLAAGTGATDAATWAQLFGASVQADIASAATTDIGVQNTSFLRVTGTTTITSFGTNYRGPRFLTFADAVTLTNSSTLVLPGGANITTAAGDSLIVIPGATLGTADKWVVVAYQKAAVVPGYVDMPGGFGFRNRIINGDMRIDQRNNGAAVANSSGYSVDRWSDSLAGSGRYTAQQSTTAPSGFTNSFQHTVTTAVTPSASDTYQIFQSIEGYNTADLGFGTASAQAVTVSFWVRSSVTGLYAISLNGGGGRSYVATYSIAAANTWEHKTATIPGDTSGTWLTNNGIGITLIFDLGSGSNQNTTAGAWQAGGFRRTSGCVNWISTSGATFFITGVQLEAGSVATPFERRPYGAELALCERYYHTNGANSYVAQSAAWNAYVFPQKMRATPSLTLTAPSGTVSPGTTSSAGFNSQGSSVAIGVTVVASAEL
jgi:hypothetical protein